MKIIPCAFHKSNNNLLSTIDHSMNAEATMTGANERLPYEESEPSDLKSNGIGYLVNEGMMKTPAHMTKREELDVMTIEQMSSEVIRRYGYEAKRTISFFRTVEKGDYEKIVKAYHKIMK